MLAIPDAPGGSAGDADAAVRQLYARHAPALRRYVERFCPDRAGADDIVQETFIRAWRHLPQLSSEDFPVRPWLFRVARNLLIDADRAARSRPVTVRSQPAEEGCDDTGLDRVLDQQLVTDALRQLSPAHRTVLVETFYQGTHARQGRPPARHTRQHGTITAPLCVAGPPPAAGRPRSDRLAMILHRSGGVPAAADEAAGPAATRLPLRRVTAIMLLAAAALDLTRCGLVVGTVTQAGTAAALVSAGLAAAAVSLWTACGCQRGARWSGWAAFLIGIASGPQAAASGFHAVYAIPDMATAVLGVLVAAGVLATAGRASGRRHRRTGRPERPSLLPIERSITTKRISR